MAVEIQKVYGMHKSGSSRNMRNDFALPVRKCSALLEDGTEEKDELWVTTVLQFFMMEVMESE